MKTTAFGFAAALALAVASFSAPASAFQVAPGLSASSSDVTTVRFDRHRHCHVRKVVSRDRHGHRVVRTVRVCR